MKHSAAISSRAIAPNIRLQLQELLQDTRWRQQTNENKASTIKFLLSFVPDKFQFLESPAGAWIIV